MIHIVLHQPEIAPNTGNVMRLAANTNAQLHLVEPLGFTLETKALRRAGLDYRDTAKVSVHVDFESCLKNMQAIQTDRVPRLFLITTQGDRSHADVRWQRGDIAVFGSESSGLPQAIRDRPDITAHLRIPMIPGNRSLNLSNAVAVVTYEAWRQSNFELPPSQ